jgi:hypothetical protein
MMRIDFERSGGFAGMRLSATVDSHSLDEAEISRLEQEIEEASFFELPAQIKTPAGGADRFQYRITVAINDQETTVEVDEAALPDSLRPLVKHLERLIRTRRFSS